MSDAAAAVRALGLLVAKKPEVSVPLVGVTVEASLKDFASRVVVSQRYRNDEPRPIEAVYVFPLEEGAAVCGFETLIDDVHVVGEVEEREKAFARYDDALADGHGAYLLDQEKADVFTASIGNVPPGKEVLVRITYVAELDLEGDDLRFALPTTVSPRYAPVEDRIGVGRPPADAVNPPRAWTVPYGLGLTIDLDMHAPIRAVASPTHGVSVEVDGTRGRVTLGTREVPLDRDFVLNVQLAKEAAPWARLERDPSGRHAVALAFRPSFETGEAPAEFVFLVDQSGSMDGTSIREARNALQLCLRSLRPGSHFNIVGFGSDFGSLFPEGRAYDDDTLARASRYVAGLEADRGGTEILRPLQAILSTKPAAGRPRQLFVLTDGQVSNTEAVIELLRRHSETTRVFAFGIGAAASHHLVRGMARAGGGSAEFIAPGERVERKVLRQLAKALTPAVSDVKVDWGGLAVRQAPHYLPPCFVGGRMLVYGLLEGEPAATTVTLRGQGPAGPFGFDLAVDPGSAEEGRLLGTLAARTMIRDLEEGASPLHDRRGSLQDRGGQAKEDRVKDEVVRLGIAYSLVSKHTSFVAVERRDAPATEKAELRRVPVALTSGWGNVGAVTGSFPRYTGAAPGASAVVLSASPFDVAMSSDETSGAAFGAPRAAAARPAPSPAGFVKRLFRSRRPAPQAPETPSSRADRPLDELVALQRADGSWELTETLARLVGRPMADLQALLAGATGDPAHARRALATALALRWLEANASDARDEWALLERKARTFLRDCPARPSGGRDWSDLA